MKLWKNNRIDQEWELDDNDIVSRFEASEWSTIEEWPTERRLRAFLTSSEHDGLSSVFEEDEFAVLFGRLFDVRRAAKSQTTPKTKGCEACGNSYLRTHARMMLDEASGQYKRPYPNLCYACRKLHSTGKLAMVDGAFTFR